VLGRKFLAGRLEAVEAGNGNIGLIWYVCSSVCNIHNFATFLMRARYARCVNTVELAGYMFIDAILNIDSRKDANCAPQNQMFDQYSVICLCGDNWSCAHAMTGIWEAINVLDAAYSNNNEFQPRTLSIAVQDKPGVLNEVWSCTAHGPFVFTLFDCCLLDLCLMFGFSTFVKSWHRWEVTASGMLSLQSQLYNKAAAQPDPQFHIICVCFSYAAADELYLYVVLPVCQVNTQAACVAPACLCARVPERICLSMMVWVLWLSWITCEGDWCLGAAWIQYPKSSSGQLRNSWLVTHHDRHTRQQREQH